MTGIDLFRLDHRAAIITGGSKGLGKAMAEGLASAGADLVITSRNDAEIQAVAKEIADQFGRNVIGLAADVTDPAGVERTIGAAVDAFGKIDILINNAGVNIRNPIEELSLDEFEQVMSINVTGPWLMCRSVAPHMKQARYGRVINMGSTLGTVALAGRTPYASSKGAVAMLTKVLALEWAEHNITVNALCPGPFLTPLNYSIADEPETKKFIVDATALGRWGELHEIQGAAIFLASDASSYITGSSLYVDGGWTAK